MKTTLLYIHGLGSDQHSRKFINLKTYFQDQFNYDFIEWTNDSDIPYLLKEKVIKYKDTPQLIIVGDSTGANFAYQLRAMRNKKKDILILTSPLLDIDKRIADFEFPKQLIPYLIKINTPENTLIIASKTDEVLDQTNWFNQALITSLNQVEVIEVKDSHRLLNFEKEAMPHIDNYLKKVIHQ